MTAPAQPGDYAYLGSMLMNMHLWGVVSDLNTPSQFMGTLECRGPNGAMTLDALVGPPGPAGDSAILLRLQDEKLPDATALPDDLLDIPEDFAKTWLIGPTAYIWTGARFMAQDIGVQGPPGPVANVHPSIETMPPESTDPESVTVTGTVLNPSWHMKIRSYRGPAGRNSRILESDDFDTLSQLIDGHVLAYNQATKKMELRPPNPVKPDPYTIPPNAFTTTEVSFGTLVTVGAFQIPKAYPTPMKIEVGGFMRAAGFELDTTPFSIAAECRLADAKSGPLVGYGDGGNTTPIHFAMWSDEGQVTPDNNQAVLPAGSTGAAATIYISLRNSGLAAAYLFRRESAHMNVKLWPM